MPSFARDTAHWLRLGALRRAALSLACVGASALATTGSESAPRTQGSVPMPVIESARLGQCVGSPAFMRRYHMDLLKHQRNETMRAGVRNARYSLQDCIGCHASQSTQSVAAAGSNFCQSCHVYAAVKIDCFECHATQPKVKP